MLTVKGLNKSFGENEILKKIDMKIKKGKVIAILGPSGSGKTTLLRCLNALEIPNRGELAFDDFSIDFSKKVKQTDILIFAENPEWYFRRITCSRTAQLLKT